MRIVSFEKNGEINIGAVVGDTVVDLNAVLADHSSLLPDDMAEFMALGTKALDLAAEAVARFGEGAHAAAGAPLSSIKLAAPVPHPPKLMMGGRNYRRHIDELRGTDAAIPVPPTPRIFAKYHTAITGPNDPVIYPRLVKQLDFEGEFSVVIGKTARYVSEEDALDFVGGYTIVNDVTARCIQATGELIVSKNFVTFAPMGPWIVTPDEIPDPHNLTVRTYINDRQVSEAHTSDMLFNIPQYIAFLSQVFPLEPGDVLTTGSPPGPGMYHDPPILTQIGDTMRVDVERIGSLENAVVAERV